jgi:hypothetical protein
MFSVPWLKDAREIHIQNLLTEAKEKQLQWFSHVERMDRIQIPREH